MGTRQPRSFRFWLINEADKAREEFASRSEALLAKVAAKGRLNSGGRFLEALETANSVLRELATRAFSRAIDDKSPIEAVEATRSILTAHFNELVQQILGDLQRSSFGRGSGQGLKRSIQHRTALITVDIDALARMALKDLGKMPMAKDQAKQSRPASKAGRHPADYWEGMWVDICCQLYTGDLKPKKQVDIERAMASYLASEGHHPSPSAIRERAQPLWRAISQDR